jgi:hypothetical protein
MCPNVPRRRRAPSKGDSTVSAELPSVRTRYEQRAAAWDAGGRPDGLLVIEEWELLAMHCWLVSDGARNEHHKAEIAETLLDFVVASFDARDALEPNWSGKLLHERTFCTMCGARYMIENLSFCTGCYNVYCFECVNNFRKGTNGNLLHGCYFGGEIVG